MSDIELEYESDVEALEGFSSEDYSDDETSELDFEEVVEQDEENEAPSATTVITREGADRTTSNVLSNFDKAKLIGLRAVQIDLGARTTLSKRQLEELPNKSSEKIAKRELELRVLPIDIIRTLPGGRYQDRWLLKEMV